jgi:hypothetical protein
MPQAFATHRASPSEQWMFKLSTTKIHDASGSVATARATCATKSSSVRVGPSDGATSRPLTTSKLPISVSVPCRLYSNSRRSASPGRIGLVAAIRSSAWMPVISSVQLVCVRPAARSRGASR